MSKINIYLAATYTDSEAIQFRNYTTEKYGTLFNLIDPKLYSESVNSDQIVERDIANIKSCDILVAYIKEPTFGTCAEIPYAYINKKIIYVIQPNGKYLKDYWLKYHTTKFFKTVDECFEHILNQLQQK